MDLAIRLLFAKKDPAQEKRTKARDFEIKNHHLVYQFLMNIYLALVQASNCSYCMLKIESYFRFKNLPASSKKSSLTILNKNILLNISKILKCLQQKKLYCISSGQTMEDFQIDQGQPKNNEVLMQLLKNMKLVILSEPFLYFQNSFSIQFCNKLVNWMESISNYKIFDLQIANKYDQQVGDNILWFSSFSFQKVENIIVSQIEKAILRHYFLKNNKSKIQYGEQIHQFYHSSEFIETSYTKKSSGQCKTPQKRLNQMIFLYETDKLKDLQKKFIEDRMKDAKLIQQRYELQKQKRQIDLILTPEKKKKKRHKKKKNQNEQNKIKENEIEKIQAQKKNVDQNISQRIEKKKQIQYDISFQEAQVKVIIQIQQVQDAGQNTEYLKSQIFGDQISHISKCETQLHQTDVTIQKYFENQPENQETDPVYLLDENNLNHQNQRQKEESQPQYIPKKNKKQSAKQKRQKQIYQIVNQNLKSLSITQFIDQISIQSNNLYSYKLTAYQNIVFFISTILPTTSITLFGSNAVGLALASSDIDIMMSNLKWNSIQQVRQVLFHVVNQIAKMGWVVDYRLILNAKVPVLKLFIDPKIDYFDISPLKYAYKTNLQESIIIKADIIINIDGQTNIGCQSTLLMKDSIGKYPQLQRIILFFKYVLWYYGYNENYKGGICSYCIFLMIMSYIENNISKQDIQNFKIQEDYEGAIINRILNYYAFDFNQQQDIISLKKILDIKQFLKVGNQNYQISPSKRQKILKIIDPINDQFIESSFSKFQQIKSLFKLMSDQIQNQNKRIKQYLFENKNLVEEYINLSTMNKSDQTKTKKIIKKILNKVIKTELKFNIKGIVGIGMKKGIDQNMMIF